MPSSDNTPQQESPKVRAFFQYSKSFPALLKQLNCSLALSTYQAGKLMFLSSMNGEHVRLYGKNVKRPMGLAVKGDQLAVAGRDSLDLYTYSKKIAPNFKPQPGHFDSLFLPQASYFTGFTDMHDIEWGNEGLWGVNTAFSCLVTMDEHHHFQPRWRPPFITELEPEDRCHLNGLAMENGEPAFVTMLDQTNVREGWRAGTRHNGLMMDVRTNEVVAENLAMPHSPRVHGNGLYFLLSAEGKVMRLGLDNGKLSTVCETNCFIRGMDIHGRWMFVGTSAVRKSSKSFRELTVSEDNSRAGLRIIDLEKGEMIGAFVFTDHIHETFDVRVLPGLIRPGIVAAGDEFAGNMLMLPSGDEFILSESEVNANKKS